MKKRMLLLSIMPAISTVILCLWGCSGGGNPEAPPIDNNNNGGIVFASDSIQPLTTWTSEIFQVPTEGGTFEFNGRIPAPIRAKVMIPIDFWASLPP